MKNSFYLCGTEQDPVLPEGPEIAVWILFNRNAEIRFADFVQIHKIKLQLTDNQLTAILRSCLGRIRTLTGGTRIRRATITPQGKVSN